MRVPGRLITRAFGSVARWLGLASALCVVDACARDPLPPLGQVLVYVDTDAPVSGGDPGGPAPLFDRLRVEIFAPGDETPCAGCARELVLDAGKLARRAFSFGFAPRPRELGWRVRLTMFRSSGLSTPRRASSVELVGYLPAVGEEGVSAITARLRVDEVGAPRGTPLRRWQRRVRPIWRCCGDGCWPDRDTQESIGQAGFARVDYQEFRAPPGTLPAIVSPHICGSASQAD